MFTPQLPYFFNLFSVIFVIKKKIQPVPVHECIITSRVALVCSHHNEGIQEVLSTFDILLRPAALDPCQFQDAIQSGNVQTKNLVKIK